MEPVDDTIRGRLLHAAIRLFAVSGRDAVSIRQIASEAGVSHGNVNYHFRSKDELYFEALMRCAPPHYAGPLTPAEIAGYAPAEAERAYADAVRACARNQLDPTGMGDAAMGFLRAELLSPDGPHELFFERVVRPGQDHLTAYVRAAAPEIGQAEAEVMAFNVAIMCLIHRVAHPLVLRLMGRDRTDEDVREMIAGVIVDTAIGALRERRGGRR